MLTWWARPDERDEPVLLSLARFVLPFTLWTMVLGVVLYSFFHFQVSDRFEDQTLPPRAIERFERITGLTFGVDADFTQVVTTLIAQSNLSNFLSVATMLLVLFLHPPHSFFTGVATA